MGNPSRRSGPLILSCTTATALVTGAAHGMGRAAAKLLGANGACVALLDVNTDGLQRVRDDLAESGCASVVLPADISRASEVDRAVADTVGRFGRLDIVVNCAAAAPWRRGAADDAKQIGRAHV